MSTENDHIAVIGIGCRYPNVASKEDFWSVLSNGVDVKEKYTQNELLNAGLNKDDLKNKKHVGVGYSIKGIDKFDAEFFNFTARDAKLLDPQIRIAYECVWQAFEDAGYSAYELSETVGVYASSSISDYYVKNLISGSSNKEPINALSYLIANDKDYIASHLAYKFNFNGPCMAVQCACSSSLVAIDLACKSLQNYSCDYAVAVGVTVHLPQKSGYFAEEESVYSSDGCCRPFDENANGMIFGDGAGVVILKRLKDALSDKDSIYAVVRASSVNNDGNNKIGYAAQSKNSQADVIVSSLLLSGIKSNTIGYVETHGTGTPIGDPIEVAALTEAFRLHTNNNKFCAIGSVKPNFGHTEAASGITSFIKAVLVLKNKKIPPSLNYQSSNSVINFDSSPFYVNTKLTDWKRSSHPRRAGVSSFGIGGTNAHVILEEGPEVEQRICNLSSSKCIVVGSGKSIAARDELIKKYELFFKDLSNDNDNGKNLLGLASTTLNDVACTASICRTHFEHRFAFIGEDFDSLCNISQEYKGENTSSDTRIITTDSKNLVFQFSYKDDQYIQVSRLLYKYIYDFKNELEILADVVKQKNIDLISFVESEEMNQSCSDHDFLVYKFTLEVCLVKWLKSIGLSSDALICNSIGHYSAACIAGVLTELEAIDLLDIHAKLMNQSQDEEFLLNEYRACLDSISFRSPNVILINGELNITIDSMDAQYLLQKLQNTYSVNNYSQVSYTNYSNEHYYFKLDSAGDIWENFLLFIGEMYVSGYNIDWNKIYGENQYNKCLLPSYPFQRKRYWVENFNQTDNNNSESNKLLIDADGNKLINSLIENNDLNIDYKYTIQELVKCLYNSYRPNNTELKKSSPLRDKDDYVAYFRSKLTSLLEISEESIDEDQSLLDVGLDSITAILLKNTIKNEIDLDIPLINLIQGQSISQILESENILFTQDTDITSSSSNLNTNIDVKDIDDMDEKELDLMLERIGVIDV